MNRLANLLLLFWFCRICHAQNLVPNGDFEQYTTCPTYFIQLPYASLWMNPSVNANSTPDYFNGCSASLNVGVPSNMGGLNYQPARSGSAYAGIYLFYFFTPDTREYLEVPLTAPLQVDSCYHFEMYVNLHDACEYTSDDIGVYFSTGAITGVTSNGPLPLTPQLTNSAGNYPDSLNWTLVSGEYVATGGENHILIGNFKPDSTTNAVFLTSNGFIEAAYCFIDDVSLTRTSCSSIPCPSLSITYSTGVTQVAASNGAMRAFVAGGQPPYSYSLDSLTFQPANTFTSLAAGAYRVYVVDDNGCTAQQDFLIREANCCGNQ